MDNIVELFKSPEIYDSIQYFEVLKELERKIENDKKILEANLSLENKINFGTNTLFYYQLCLDAITMNSIIASSNLKYQDDGWFIWLQIFDYYSAKELKSNDEKLTYFFDLNFDKFFTKVSNDQLPGKYYYQSVKNYKDGNYYSCVCGLFPLIENIEKQISDFDGKTKFSIKKELSKNHVPQEQKYRDYFEKFEKSMNSFLSNYVYSSSTESEEEPKVISRNRVLHGILTRDINKTDCLKLFCIYCSLYSFNSWIETFTKIERLKLDLKKLEEKKEQEEK